MPASRGKEVYVDRPLDFLYLRNKYSWITRHRLHYSMKKELRRSLKKGWDICAADGQIALELHRYYKIPLNRVNIRKR